MFRNRESQKANTDVQTFMMDQYYDGTMLRIISGGGITGFPV